MKRRWRFGLWVLAALVFPHAGLSAAEMVVIGSTDPGLFGEGTIIDSEQVIEVPNGVSVTLMDESGAVTTVRGPYSAAVGAGESGKDDGLVEVVSSLFTENPSFPLGAFRAMTPAKRQDPWAIDASTPGDKCATRGDAVTLWQPSQGRSGTLTLTHLDSGKSAEIEWPAKVAALDWPGDVPLVQGAKYDAMLSHQIRPNRFTLHIAEPAQSQGPQALAWLVNARCYAQAKALLADLPVDRELGGS